MSTAGSTPDVVASNARAGLSVDPPFSARKESEECTPVKLAHLVELRSTLAATYVRRAVRLPHWTNASPAAGQVLRVDKRDSLGGPLAKHIAGVGRPKSANPREGLTPVHTQAFEAEAEPVGVGVTGGDGPAGLAPRGAHRVGSTTRARGLGEGAGGPPGAGGDRAARGRPTATPTFGAGARRVPRRAPVRDEPPGGLVRLLNTWPHDRHDSRRRSSRRSAVIARDRGC